MHTSQSTPNRSILAPDRLKMLTLNTPKVRTPEWLSELSVHLLISTVELN